MNGCLPLCVISVTATVYHTSDSWDGLQPAHDLELAKLSRKWIDDLVDIVYDQSVES